MVQYLTKIPGVEVTRDNFGNIYAVKGETEFYPCVIAHTDINQDYTTHLKIVRNEKWVYGMDMDNGLQCGVGFDDKNGCLFALTMLKHLDAIKIAFFKDEEIGAVGSKKADPTFFYDCSMIFQMDRNSYKGLELITYTNGVTSCSKEFVEAAQPLMTKYSVTEGNGIFTDVGEIVKLAGVDCIGCNFSAGYFDEHSEREITSIQALENSINFGYECLLTLGSTKWYHRAGNFQRKDKRSYRDEMYDAYFVEQSAQLQMPDYEYRHVFSELTDEDYLNDTDILYDLNDGFCPCCGSQDLCQEGYSHASISCFDCGSLYFVPTHYLKEQLNQPIREGD